MFKKQRNLRQLGQRKQRSGKEDKQARFEVDEDFILLHNIDGYVDECCPLKCVKA